MSEFKREPRYVVFKIKDIEKHLTQGEKDSLMCIGEELAFGRAEAGKPPFNAVVVEQDWPEFDVVWAMIRDRMAGQPNEIERLRAEVAALRRDLEDSRALNSNLADSNAAVLARAMVLEEALKNHGEEAAKMVNAEPASREDIQNALIYGKPALYTYPRIPDGWVMVPKEPIIGANYEAGLWSRRNWEAALEDMIAAAPKPE